MDFGESKDISFSAKMNELGSHSLSIENIIRNCRVLAPPDFLVENFHLEERQVRLENMVSGTFDIKNIGGIKGTKAVNIRIGEKIKTKKAALEPGESKTVDFAIEVKEVGEQEIELENLSTSIEVVKPATFEYTDLSISEKNIYLGEAVEVSLKVKNTGDIEGEKKVKLYLNGDIEKEKKITLNPNESRKLRFTITENVAGNYNIEIGNLSAQFEIINPRKSPLQHLDYYYGTAEVYVKKDYSMPQEKDIQSLYRFLMNLDPFPEYDMDTFSCSETTARLEWLLEGGGFDANVVLDYSLSKVDAPTIGGHTWVTVKLGNGDMVAIEATYFTKSNYNPPGIIMKPDGTYKKYSWKYEMFQDWKEKYPPSEYAYDPDMSLSEWEEEYLTEIDLGLFSTPSQYGYYYPVETYRNPAQTMKGSAIIPKSQWDWWNVPPYSQTSPFSKWD